jgi:hypothetical protein
MKANLKFFYIIAAGIILNLTIVTIVYSQVTTDLENPNHQVYFKNIPAQPGEETWGFIQDLKSPMWTYNWATLPKSINSDHSKKVALSHGIQLKNEFLDPDGLLSTAYEDLHHFLYAAGIKNNKSGYIVKTQKVEGLPKEAFRIEVNEKQCRIQATDIEGIRRGIFYLEDELLSQHACFLSLHNVYRQPFIHRRISRCFYSPIKRPPKMRDELIDNEDYYPDNYLNRLAHEGINGLWLTVSFKDLCTTPYTPDAGKDKEKRLGKLRQIVNKCLRYGIRIYIFCIEPQAWDERDPVLKNFPELGGARRGNQVCFCPSSDTAQQYLYESVNSIFKAVPKLGGMINISHGERTTTCLSTISANSEYMHPIQCPRCSKKFPWQILYESLSAMEKGMHDASPNAVLISWLYMPQPQQFAPKDSYALGKWVYTIPAHTPKGVILQFNFTSGVKRTEFGKLLVGGDYWLSMPGPSSRFCRIADIARKNGTLVSAKIQTSNSHEVATVPYVPVPSLLYRKFAAMKSLGVSNSMLCWFFGNYPGLMNKAAGLLSFEPFANEKNFLQQLASSYWEMKDVSNVVRAWQLFSEAYQNYPLTNMFQYYGPMHDGPVWPLFLKPADTPLSPTWQISIKPGEPWPPSGDRIGECIGQTLTLDETVELCRRMTVKWDSGLTILNRLIPPYHDNPDCMSQISVAQALGIQFRSGYDILRFYSLREKMFRMHGLGRLSILKQLNNIIRTEIMLDKQLLSLSINDPSLGFHSEAEGYKYYPAKIKWRISQLQEVLSNEVPGLAQQIRNDKPLFPNYTGISPEGLVAYCTPKEIGSVAYKPFWQALNVGKVNCNTGWMASYDSSSLYITVSDSIKDNFADSNTISHIILKIEPKRLWPAKHFIFSIQPANQSKDNVRILNDSGILQIVMRIPFEDIGVGTKEDFRRIRINIEVHFKDGAINSWVVDHPLASRLILGSDNPRDLGWLIFR